MAMAGYEQFKCIQCGGTELCFGYKGASSNVFVPSGIFTFHGYKARHYVCVDCGFMGEYIPKDRLQKLREKFKARFDSEQ